MADFIAWHGRTLAQHIQQRDSAAKQGYRFLSLSIYGSVDKPAYAAVMIRRPQVVAQRDWPCLTANEFQSIFNQEAELGYGPVMISATGSASDPRFAVVFQPTNPIPLTRHRLGSGDASDTGTIQGMNAKAKADGLILRCMASYGDPGNPRFAAIWQPNTTHALWNADGVLDTSSEYQGRFNAYAETWCRPAFVTLDAGGRYASLFIDNDIGPWVARHNMSAADYQATFDTWTAKGYFPFCVQAAGADAGSARFAALFAQTEQVVPKQFHAAGPVANTAIDAVIRQAMQDSPVRHAALAIVFNKRLVYARGYTMAEPSWPLAQPTSCFRMASVSKTMASLAIFQLIGAGKLKLSDKLETILGLKTPSGGAPADNRFGTITVKHLLEHTSGLNPNAFNDGVAVQQAFADAGHIVALPVTAAMTDSYIASLGMVSDPGAKQVYNNCGYYLLGRIVAKLRAKTKAIDAFQASLFDPLSIHRIRRGVSLVVGEPVDEARYQDPALTVGRSMMTADRPLVASEYGNEQLEIMEGSGGLTGAVTDIARIAAMVMDQSDTAAMKRSTLTGMLSAGAGLSAAGMGRAGYGFDFLAAQPNGRFYGQKGGSLASSGNVFEVNGDWGFVMNWGGKATAAQGWYPDYPAVMNIAKTVNWGTGDLFPQFGMPSL